MELVQTDPASLSTLLHGYNIMLRVFRFEIHATAGGSEIKIDEKECNKVQRNGYKKKKKIENGK